MVWGIATVVLLTKPTYVVAGFGDAVSVVAAAESPLHPHTNSILKLLDSSQELSLSLFNRLAESRHICRHGANK